jgi:N-acetylmuramoyl-L-alanine amidase
MGISAVCSVLVVGLLSGQAPPAAAPATDTPDRPRTLRLAPERGGVAAVDVRLDSEFRPAGGGRYRTSRMPAAAFSMVGFTWPSGPDARLRVRVHGAGGWGSWQRAEPMPEASGSELLWVHDSDGVQVESRRAPVPGLEMTLIEPRRVALPARQPVAAKPKPGTPHRAPRPDLRSRRAWGADERLRDGSPHYNRTIQQVHVHHTVNSNHYKRSDVPGLIRGMYRYHTQNLGWSDIGYNFLVDRFGRIWVGRAGGPSRAVRGAHTLGFNSTSTGIAMIGNYETAWPWKKARTAIVQLAAWKLDKYGRDPAGYAHVYSHGSDRFPSGRTVRLPVIDGHRDTNLTACPGDHLYAKLPRIRQRAAERVARFG